MNDPEVVVVGGGHNALAAAAYLAAAGRRVEVLEARAHVGGAAVSEQPFAGVGARLSRYSYLVSLLPRRIVDDLQLDLELRSRRVAWYAPVGADGLLADRRDEAETQRSFAAVTGSATAYVDWLAWERDLAAVAEVVAPTLLEPLPTEAVLRDQLPPDLWHGLVERPLGELVERRIPDDTLRGVVLTDALIGTFTHAHDPSLRQNQCFLYHVVGNGTGEWRVPVGGMGAVSGALEQAASRAGARLTTGARVVGVEPLPGGGATVVTDDGRRRCAPVVLVGCAPAVLSRLLGEAPATAPEGSQLKINLVLRRLPRLRSGLDPETAFAGTLHLAQGYRQLDGAYADAAAGRVPDPLPCEVYCHTLTDRSILSPELERAGYQTLTLFGLHTPARLFQADAGARERATAAALASLRAVLAEPLEDCLAVDADGRPCVETLTPVDLERELALPGGHIFHGDLQWPWRPEGADPQGGAGPAERWGVATAHPGVLMCGSGAVRGGAVSAIGGQNAAMAVLEAG